MKAWFIEYEIVTVSESIDGCVSSLSTAAMDETAISGMYSSVDLLCPVGRADSQRRKRTYVSNESLKP